MFFIFIGLVLHDHYPRSPDEARAVARELSLDFPGVTVAARNLEGVIYRFRHGRLIP